MNNQNKETVQKTVETHIPHLENVLADYALRKDEIDPSMMLYLRNCGLGTAALQASLKNIDGLRMERKVTYLDKPRDLNFRRPSHAILQSGGVMIDPTPNQFMEFVGLTAERAEREGLHHLYLPDKYWVFTTNEARNRANAFAEHAYSVDRQNLVPHTGTELGSIGGLRGASLEEMREVYQTLWDSANYAPFPIDDQPDHFRRIGEDLTNRTKQDAYK